ncbi:hypothetical protein FF38_10297 [Lucilia cuprina]|uniref:Neuroparsin-A n=1 Tax=Lucilia cuprina TaxID=7375 RepID=A0A0L0CL90_LUCCU|nr:hypothetical protein FF38_10297 [Lucilia cuprina]
MISRAQTRIVEKHNITLLMLLVFSVWWQCCCAYKLSTLTRNREHLNPNLRCPGKNEQNIWRPCKHGGYIEKNPDPKNCDDRYICYAGLNEPCQRSEECAYNAICTMCGVCQKCDDPENCSDFELCPNINGFRAMNYIKRHYDEEDAAPEAVLAAA